MDIRRAQPKDIPALCRLLTQVLKVHHEGRPDLFLADGQKYTDEQLAELLRDDARPIFVAVDDADAVKGYVFCMHRIIPGGTAMYEQRTLYIDDLCVEEDLRGQHIGRQLYEYVRAYAAEQGFASVILNVWEFNKPARAFYETLGMHPQRTIMEDIL